MRPDALKATCLELTGPLRPSRSAPRLVFKVGGKIFALSALDATQLSVSLKCDPDLAVRLRAPISGDPPAAGT